MEKVPKMSIDEMKNGVFPSPSLEEWRLKTEQSLRGRKLESLTTDTFEGIELKPLYTREDQGDISQYPGQADYRRGTDAVGLYKEGWKVAQKLRVRAGKLKETLTDAISRGQTALSFEVTDETVKQFSDLEELHGHYPYSLNAKQHYSFLLGKVSHFSSHQDGKGYIGQDPVALLAENGAATDTIEAAYDELYVGSKKASTSLPHIRTLLVDTCPYHNGGANGVQELAIALSTAVTHIEELSKRGFAIETIFSKLVFQFSIGANFFMELAKLRAARVLWSRIAEAYEIDGEKHGMVISAATSSFTKTAYDPYVNMLRAGNEAFAAVLGGVQYLHVSPFNEPEGNATEFSERVARNTQLILKEEAHLTRTIDPAGGSWYVEHLTSELVRKAWDFFLLIEEKGGILEALKQGWLQEEIAAVLARRVEAVANGVQTIVGTNKYTDKDGDKLNVPRVKKELKSGVITPIPQRRLSESFEKDMEVGADE